MKKALGVESDDKKIIYEVMKVDVLNIGSPESQSSVLRYKTGLKKFFSYGGFYYSNQLDLTK